jgi:hypothetical protein
MLCHVPNYTLLGTLFHHNMLQTLWHEWQQWVQETFTNFLLCDWQVDWPLFITGFDRCCKQGLGADRLKSLLTLFGDGESDGPLPGLQLEGNKDLVGFVTVDQVHDLLCLCWLMMCHARLRTSIKLAGSANSNVSFVWFRLLSFWLYFYQLEVGLGLSWLQRMIDLGLGHDRVMGLRLNLRISSGSLLWQDTLIIVQEMDITLPDLRPLYNSFYSAATGSYPDKTTDVSSKEEILVERLCSWILTVIPGISECMAQYVQAQLQRLGSENNEVSFLSTRSAWQCTCLVYLPKIIAVCFIDFWFFWSAMLVVW